MNVSGRKYKIPPDTILWPYSYPVTYYAMVCGYGVGD
jgi:squalene cyclase